MNPRKMDIHRFDLVHSDYAKYLDSYSTFFFNNGKNVQRCHAAFCQWLMDQEKALEIEEIERLQCELQAQEDPVTLGRAPFCTILDGRF
jgi:hypothetical protein